MAYNFSALQKKVKDTQEWLQKEYFIIRTGRATPAVLDGVKVESYGSLVSLNQVATISVEDVRTLRVLPFDPSIGKHVEKAIAGSNLGFSVSVDERGVRVFFPELTAENRAALIKVVKERLEKAKMSLRGERDLAWSAIQKEEKEKRITEDEKFKDKETMQKYIDEGNKKLDDIASRKEQELKG